MNKTKLLEIGNVVFMEGLSGLVRLEVIRVTKTQAICKGNGSEHRIKREVTFLRGKWLTSSINKYMSCIYKYFLGTPDLQKQFEAEDLENWIKYNWMFIPLKMIKDIRDQLESDKD